MLHAVEPVARRLNNLAIEKAVQVLNRQAESSITDEEITAVEESLRAAYEANWESSAHLYEMPIETGETAKLINCYLRFIS